MSFRIEHRIGVAAPASEVWDLVYHLEGWKDWTGVYSEARGKIAIGETLHFTFTIGDRSPMRAVATVFDWVPEAQLAWNARLAGGVRTLRYVEIEKLSETTCILSNGDYYSGLGSHFMSRALRRDIRAAFQRMNENAKHIAEVRWAEKGGTVAAPTAPARRVSPLTIQPLKPTIKTGKPWGFGGRGFGPRLNAP
jgi:hypothetical protein